jgi:DNA (cytosine-5)-methyltransferase 1
MRYGSVCSGIEAATLAWHHLGWTPAFFSEIEQFPRAVLKHHYPDVPLHGDFRTIEADQYGAIDLLVGGTPCQDFSVAGLRKGLDGDRGALTIEFLHLAGRLRPKWLVWENVPGVLSADEGRAFGIFLGLLGELGYGFAYRVLDAQHFGVPQRRRRVFVVGYLGDWRRAAAVLFEPESLSGDPAPRRKKGKVTPSISASGAGVSRVKGAARSDDLEWIEAVADADADAALGARRRHDLDWETYVAHALRAEGADASEDGTGRGTPLVVNENVAGSLMASGAGMERPAGMASETDFLAVAPTLQGHADKQWIDSPMVAAPLTGDPYADRASEETNLIPFDLAQVTSVSNYSNPQPGDPCHPLTTAANQSMIAFSCKDDGGDAQEGIAPTLRAINNDEGNANGGSSMAIAYQCHGSNVGEMGVLRSGNGNETGGVPFVSSALTESYGRQPDGAHEPALHTMGAAVRRLMPIECEGLQGTPPNYTLVPYRGKPAADAPRYRALGNSMAVPVMRWIGERIVLVESLALEMEGIS